MSTIEILEELMNLPTFNKKQENNPYKLGKILTKYGTPKKHTSKGCEYLVKKK